MCKGDDDTLNSEPAVQMTTPAESKTIESDPQDSSRQSEKSARRGHNTVDHQSIDNDHTADKRYKPVKCKTTAGVRMYTEKVVLRKIVTQKRKQVIADMHGNKAFVIVAKVMQFARNSNTQFPNTDGGDLVSKFERKRRPLLKQALNAKIAKLQEKRKNKKEKKRIRPTAKAPRNISEASAKTDAKE